MEIIITKTELRKEARIRNERKETERILGSDGEQKERKRQKQTEKLFGKRKGKRLKVSTNYLGRIQ